jgi:hypothetical protein
MESMETYPSRAFGKVEHHHHSEQGEEDLECDREPELGFASNETHSIVCSLVR